MRTIGVITFSRSDYSTCRPVIRKIMDTDGLRLQLMVGGMHLSRRFGLTAGEIEKDGFPVDCRLRTLAGVDSPLDIASSIGKGTIAIAKRLAVRRPDILLMVGDRYELLSAASAALMFRVPVAHVSGGDVSEGALDNQVRHAVSKMSHIHFVAMREHAARLRQMGEEASRIVVSGDPALDAIRTLKLLDRRSLEQSLGLPLTQPVTVLTYHPAGGDMDRLGKELDVVLGALAGLPGTIIVTGANADEGNGIVMAKLGGFAAARKNTGIFLSLGQLRYYSLLRHANLMVGNSSSGIWEAPGFKLPVVNIGDRQRGRHRAENVIDAGISRNSILAAVRKGLSDSFRKSLTGLKNPYGDGHGADRIVKFLKNVRLDDRFLMKRFVDGKAPR